MRGDWYLRPAVSIAVLCASGSGCEPDGPVLTPDLEPPQVIAMEPADGATAISPSAVVKVRFSEPVAVDSLGPPPLRVVGSLGPVAGVAQLDPTSTQLLFVPAAPFAAATDFRLVLAAGITDRNGNARADSVVTRFTTALAFHDYGRIFIANTFALGYSLRALDVVTYEEAPDSPLALAMPPVQLCGVPETGEIYLLYSNYLNYGVMVIDARALAILRDSGPVFPKDITDLAVSAADGLLFMLSPSANSMLVLDTVTFADIRPPLGFERAAARPARVTVSADLRVVFVGLDGASQLVAYRLPALDPVPGFPVPVVREIHTIAVEKERLRVWVGGARRYAIVDLVQLARTVTFQIPTMANCQADIQIRAISILLSPAHDRVYFLESCGSIASLSLSNLDVPDTHWQYLIGNHADLVQNPRNGDLVVVDAFVFGVPVRRIDPVTLREIFTGPRTPIAYWAVDMEVMP